MDAANNAGYNWRNVEVQRPIIAHIVDILGVNLDVNTRIKLARDLTNEID